MEAWNNIAKIGTFTDMNGQKVRFTEELLEKIVENYKNSQVLAPLVLGHPTTQSPAYGWIEALRMQGEFLQGKFTQVHESIKEAVKKGLYKYGSLSLDSDLIKINHFGLLGAIPPAIEGLGSVAFARNLGIHLSACRLENPVFEKQYTKENTMEKSTLSNQTALLGEDLSLLLSQSQEEVKKLQEEVARLTTENLELLKSLEEQKAKEGLEGYKKRLEELILEGKILPGEMEEITGILQSLTQATAHVQFSRQGSHFKDLAEAYLRSLERRSPSNLAMNFSKHREGNFSSSNNIHKKL